jgi:carboxylate-amine ligase
MSSPWTRGSGRLIFRGSERPRIGIRWELFIIDVSTGALVPAAEMLLEGAGDGPQRLRAGPGLYRSTLRLDTGLHADLVTAREVLERTVEILNRRASAHGLALIGAGTHPSAEWAEQEITAGPEAEALVLRMQWVIRRMLTCGLHILVGVPDGEKAIAVSNSLACYIPLFLALSSNSPYWRSRDTGLASCRVRMLDNVPTGGIPPSFINWAEFQLFLNTLRAANALEGYHQIWWDIHPNPGEGAIEVEVCDAPATIAEVTVLAALVQAVTMGLLLQYDDGETLLSLDHWVKQENRWRAARFGSEGTLIASRDGNLVPFSEFTRMALAWATPIAETLGTARYVGEVEPLFANGTGAHRQRMMHAACGQTADACAAVVQGLSREFQAGHPLPPPAGVLADTSGVFAVEPGARAWRKER